MTNQFHSVAGETRTFTFTGTNAAGAPESITGDTLTFRAWDDDGNEIVKETDSGITTLTQSGATLGQASIAVNPADYPAAWLALPFAKSLEVNVEVRRVTAGGSRRHPVQSTWKITGRGIQ